jgi:hypothetical protein
MADLSNLTAFSMPLATIAQFAFYFVAGVYVIFTAILYYHWQTYATDAKVTTLTLVLYFASTLPLLLVMGIMLFII